MKRILLLITIAAARRARALLRTRRLRSVSSEKKTIKEADIATFEKSRTVGTVEGSNLRFTTNNIRLIVLTGPEDDMLSYRIQGVRNPNLVVPAGATLRILFINIDVDMRHDIRFGHVAGEFTATPEIQGTAGSAKVNSRGSSDLIEAEDLVIKATENGAYKYFCSVRSHANGGMWGNIFVGIKPGSNVKMSEKSEHVHSPDEEKDDHAHPAPAASPTPRKNRMSTNMNRRSRIIRSIRCRRTYEATTEHDHGEASAGTR
jgi:plastocyanin